jgi:hypothetical protein
MNFSRFKQAAVVTVAVATVSLLTGRSAVFAAQSPAPTSQAAPQTTAQPEKHTHGTPTNLQILPKNLTGEQVHEIMEKWEGELGTGCKTCHTASKELGPNGRPQINFADDSKDEKKTARKMYKMVEDINSNYISKIDSSGAPVTCGTCHRGHLSPEPFVPKPEADHDHAH